MGSTTGISWTGASWNPWTGCRKVSPGCKHCYMYRDKERYGHDPRIIRRSQPATFRAPLKWQREAETGKRRGHNRYVFTCPWSDFFLEEADPWRDEAFAIMALCPHLTFQVLTKRAEAMPRWLLGEDEGKDVAERITQVALDMQPDALDTWSHQVFDFDRDEDGKIDGATILWPLPNVWLGVSVENRAALGRLDYLYETPAALHFASFEPLLEDLGDLSPWLKLIEWAIISGESGPRARKFDPQRASNLLWYCERANIPVWIKQMGSNVWWGLDVEPLPWPGQSVESMLIHGEYEAPAPVRWPLKHRAGADPTEWPEALRVQDMPKVHYVTD